MTSAASTQIRVTFDSEGAELVGDLHLPAVRRPDERLSALVVTGSWTTVKEQMAGVYARRLAERGFAALAFDFRGFGESAGEPRDYESPMRKAEDIHHAITFLGSRPDVDAERLAAVGVCASSGYTAINAARDERVRSLVLIAPWLHYADLVRDLYGGEEGVLGRIEAGESAREQYEQTGEVADVPAISTTDESAAMFGDFDYYLNPERGAIPEWPNRFAVMSWPEWLGFDPIRLAPEILAPTLLVHSPDAAVPDGARRFHRDLAGPADFLWTQGTQFDFYDQEPQPGRPSARPVSPWSIASSRRLRRWTSRRSSKCGPMTESRKCPLCPRGFRAGWTARRRCVASTAGCRRPTRACASTGACIRRLTRRWSSPSTTDRSRRNGVSG